MRTVASLEAGFVVRNIDALLGFYTGVLGFTLVGDLQVPPQKSGSTGLSPDGYRIVRLETDRGDRLKLVQPIRQPAPRPAQAHAFARDGNAYVTFLVNDLEDVHGRLQRSDAVVRSDGVVEIRPGVKLLLATDPAGNFLEFVQYDDLAAHRPRG